MNNTNDYGADRFNFSRQGTYVYVNEEKIPFEQYKEQQLLKNKERLTISEICNVGDVVVLKDTNQIVLIDKVEFKINGMKVSDYAGYSEDDSKNLILFGQEDILEKCVDGKKLR